jgi:PAS domain S-box-containing protein
MASGLSDVTERKQAEARLCESEERFRNMADSAPVMIWVTAADKRATFFNKRCMDFTGYSIEEILDDGWILTLHPDDRESYVGLFSSSIDARQEFQSLIRLRRADGEYRWVLSTGVPRFELDGAFAGFIGSCIDITEQKLIEERLRTSEARLMEAQRLANVGYWERHIGSDTIVWSEEMLRILGLSDEAPASFPAFLNYVYPKDRDKVMGIDAQVRSSSAAVDVEYRIVRPGGEVRFVRSMLQAIRDERGVPIRITGATHDITGQVQIRESLEESEERLNSAQRLTHVGSWHWNIGVNQVICSEECKRIFGQPQDYAPSLEGLLQIISPQDRGRVANEIRRGIAEKGGCSTEFQVVRPNGDVRTVTFTSKVFVDEDGSPRHIFGACQDVTDARRVQEESIARQKLESVGTLARGIAHDFNNLLGGVLAQAELGLGELATGSNPEEGLKSIRNVAIRGSEIVRQLMIYAGKESDAVGLVDFSQIVKEMIELLRVSISKHARLEADLDQDLGPVSASAAQLRQIVMNLVMNASDALGEQDGVIRVTTRHAKVGRDSGPISDRLAEGDYVQFEVSDTGCGMSQETVARIFDPFFTTKAAGHGLGLAVVDGIVRNLGGTIHVSSELGRGATFQILLRCAGRAAESNPSLTSGPVEPARTQECSVLVVEDEDPLRRAVVKMLRRAGFVVLEATNGSAAIDHLRANEGKIDVMLLDMTIPGASSREVVAEAARVWPDIRVILTSAYSQEMLTTIGASQVSGFIRKPFQFGDLVKLVRSALATA